MSDIWTQINNVKTALGDYFWVMLIGLAGGSLNMDKKIPSMNKIRGYKKLTARFAATISSVAICGIVFAVAKFITGNIEASLAAGGYCAWQGAEWTHSRINKLLNRRINQAAEYRGQDRIVDDVTEYERNLK